MSCCATAAPKVASRADWTAAPTKPVRPADQFAKSLGAPQHVRTFVEGCVCGTGAAGGGCCPGGASSLALQSGCGAHSAMGWASGALGVLGLYGGIQVLYKTAFDAAPHISRMQQHVKPQIERLALAEANAKAAVPALPHGRISAHKQALGVWARSLSQAGLEQRFNFWVPGVLQTLAAASATGVAAAHVGLLAVSPAIGAGMGVAAPALFATYGLLLAVKYGTAWRRTPPPEVGSSGASAPHQAYLRAAQSYHRLHQITCGRTAIAWGLVGTVGAVGALVSAGVCALPVGPWVWFALSLGAAGFAMWQNRHTRFASHLPISAHVQPEFVGTPKQRQDAAAFLLKQDAAIKAVTPALLDNAPWQVRALHLYERAFSPQCGPQANRITADVMQRACTAACPTEARRMTGAVLGACLTWCAQEIALVHQRHATARASCDEDNELLQAILQPSCRHKKARMQQTLEARGAFVHTKERHEALAQQDEALISDLADRLQVLTSLQSRLQELKDADMTRLIGPEADSAEAGPAQTWLWARLELLLLSGTLADAVGPDLITRYPELFSQLAVPDALPIQNVYVLPSQIEAFAQAMAPRIDGAFVHAFCNPRRIEAEIDYLLKLKYAASESPEALLEKPECSSKTCCS